jgi:DNA modification methylase
MGEAARNILDRLREYTEPTLATTYATHGLHPYPAKFIPQIPADIIREHTNERHVVFDPFCGSGTTLVEALLHGRRSIGCDNNPIAALISRAKTTSLNETARGCLQTLVETIHRHRGSLTIPKCPIPSEPKLNWWFAKDVIEELAWLKFEINRLGDAHARQFALCVFSSIIVSVSNQESDTRYAAIKKKLERGETLGRFLTKLNKGIKAAGSLKEFGSSLRLLPAVYCCDLRSLTAQVVPDNSADLIVTSPPYPNSYDYYLYHKWRMVWLDYDFRVSRSDEIGSRNEHSSKRAPIEVFESKMRAALINVGRILKPSKLAYFLVGDSVLNGRLIDAGDCLKRITSNTNLRLIESTAYPLGQITRSFREKVSQNCHGGARDTLKQQRILVFESIRTTRKSPHEDRKTVSSKATLNSKLLKGIIRSGSRIAIESSDRDRHIHSLVRYPSKFVPTLPAWAINTFTSHGSLILDPFCGSGTTSVEAILNGRSAAAADISPYACLVTRAKTTRVKEELLYKEASRLREALTYPLKLPNARRLEFELDSFWFDTEHLTEFARILTFVESEIDKKCRDFFLACLAGTVRRFSYQDEAQIKVKRDGRKVISGTEEPSRLLVNSIDKNVPRLCSFMNLASSSTKSHVFNISADRIDQRVRKVDAIITSPPYVNAMNYPMTHRYENILLGLIDPIKKKEHEKEYFGSERVGAIQYRQLAQVPEQWSFGKDLNYRLEKIFGREKKRSFIAYKYFVDMYRSFATLKSVLRPNGHIVLIAGRNTIKGVQLPTFEYLAKMLEDFGLQKVTTFDYEIYKQSLKITRHETANVIRYDGVAVFKGTA